MTTAPLNSAEKQLLRFWLADQAPGYTKVTVNSQNQMQRAILEASDYVAIDAMDNDVVRGYLTSYKSSKLTELTKQITQAAAQVTRAQALATNLTAENTAISAITVQTVPTTA